jgi:hypothetical protein
MPGLIDAVILSSLLVLLVFPIGREVAFRIIYLVFT